MLPSLSGYVFSAPPLELADATASRIAERCHGLMTALGYERYGACGSDVGARVSAWLGAVAPDAVIGLHATSNAISPAEPTTAAERTWLERQDEWWDSEGAYGHIQRTKPRTLAMAMNDSPVGLAAWILEKWTDWGDADGDAISYYGAQALLTTITLHWFAGSIGTSFLTYAAATLPPGPRPPAGPSRRPRGSTSPSASRTGTRRAASPSGSTAWRGGRRCHAEAISWPPRSRSSTSRTCASSSVPCAAAAEVRRPQPMTSAARAS